MNIINRLRVDILRWLCNCAKHPDSRASATVVNVRNRCTMWELQHKSGGGNCSGRYTLDRQESVSVVDSGVEPASVQRLSPGNV